MYRLHSGYFLLITCSDTQRNRTRLGQNLAKDVQGELPQCEEKYGKSHGQRLQHGKRNSGEVVYSGADKFCLGRDPLATGPFSSWCFDISWLCLCLVSAVIDLLYCYVLCYGCEI